jgi:hypothetical protein
MNFTFLWHSGNEEKSKFFVLVFLIWDLPHFHNTYFIQYTHTLVLFI